MKRKPQVGESVQYFAFDKEKNGHYPIAAIITGIKPGLNPDGHVLLTLFLPNGQIQCIKEGIRKGNTANTWNHIPESKPTLFTPGEEAQA